MQCWQGSVSLVPTLTPQMFNASPPPPPPPNPSQLIRGSVGIMSRCSLLVFRLLVSLALSRLHGGREGLAVAVCGPSWLKLELITVLDYSYYSYTEVAWQQFT